MAAAVVVGVFSVRRRGDLDVETYAGLNQHLCGTSFRRVAIAV